MTRELFRACETTRAFSAARALAISDGLALADFSNIERAIAISSIFAGTTSKRSPDDSSMALRAELADAKIKRRPSSIGGVRFGLQARLSILQKLQNHRRALFDRATRHVDDRPAVLGRYFSRIGN